MRRFLLIVAALLPLTLLAWGLSQNPRQADEDPGAGARSAALNAARDELIAGASAQVLAGAETYDLVCAACHGDSGLGYPEGVQSFPQSHQRCSRCHKDHNSGLIAQVQLSETNSFNLGEPPPLRGEGALLAFPNGLVLYQFIRAAMPRHAPGSLSGEEYLGITAFLLRLHEVLPEGVVVSEANLAEFVLPGSD